MSFPEYPPPMYGLPPNPGSSPRQPEPSSSVGDQIVFVIVAMLAGVVLGFVGALIWATVADPPSGLVTDRGVFLVDELAFNQQVVVTLWFLAVGAGLGLVSGVVIGAFGRRQGIVAVLAVLAMTAVACALTAWIGVHVFGPDPRSQLADADVGDTITTALEVSSFVAYLGWPIGGLVGLLGGVASWPNPKPRTPQWVSSSLSAQ